MKKTLAVSIAIAFLMSAGFAYARAQNSDSDGNENKNRAKERVEERKAWREEWSAKKEEIRSQAAEEKEKIRQQYKEKYTEEKCAKIQAQIQKRNSNYGSSKEKHMSVYNNLVNRIQKFMDRFQAAGLDVSVLTADLDTLKLKIGEFKTAYTTYAANLKTAKTYACSQSEGDFRSQLEKTKAELKIVHDIAADIRLFVRTTILPDIKALKAQMPEDGDADEAEDQDDQDEADEGDENDADTVLPTVTITAPADNATIATAQAVAVAAEAADSVGVSKVEFYLGDTLKGTDTTAPYAVDWNVTAADNGAYSWLAKAYDAANNIGTSTAVNVTVNIPAAE